MGLSKKAADFVHDTELSIPWALGPLISGSEVKSQGLFRFHSNNVNGFSKDSNNADLSDYTGRIRDLNVAVGAIQEVNRTLNQQQRAMNWTIIASSDRQRWYTVQAINQAALVFSFTINGLPVSLRKEVTRWVDGLGSASLGLERHESLSFQSTEYAMVLCKSQALGRQCDRNNKHIMQHGE